MPAAPKCARGLCFQPAHPVKHVVPDRVHRRPGFGQIPDSDLGSDAERGWYRQIVPAHRVDAVALVAQDLARAIRIAVEQHHRAFGAAVEGTTEIIASCDISRGTPPCRRACPDGSFPAGTDEYVRTGRPAVGNPSSSRTRDGLPRRRLFRSQARWTSPAVMVTAHEHLMI